jgi:hypothetical protein
VSDGRYKDVILMGEESIHFDFVDSRFFSWFGNKRFYRFNPDDDDSNPYKKCQLRIEFPENRRGAMTLFQELNKLDFPGPHTRAISVRFHLYNFKMNRLADVELVFEKPLATGMVIPKHYISVYPVVAEHFMSDYDFTAFESVSLYMLLFIVVIGALEVFEACTQNYTLYFTSITNGLDWLIVTFFALYWYTQNRHEDIVRPPNVAAADSSSMFTDDDSAGLNWSPCTGYHHELEDLTDFHDLSSWCLALLSLALYLKALDYIQVWPKFAVLTIAITKMVYALLLFAILLIIVLAAFSTSMSILQPAAEHNSDFFEGLIYQFHTSITGLEMDGDEESMVPYLWTIRLMGIGFSVLVVLIMLNLIITLFMDIYAGVNDEAQLELTVKFASDLFSIDGRYKALSTTKDFVLGVVNGTEEFSMFGRKIRFGFRKPSKVAAVEALALGSEKHMSLKKENTANNIALTPHAVSNDKVCRLRDLYSGCDLDADTVEEFTAFTDFPEFAFYSGDVVSGMTENTKHATTKRTANESQILRDQRKRCAESAYKLMMEDLTFISIVTHGAGHKMFKHHDKIMELKKEKRKRRQVMADMTKFVDNAGLTNDRDALTAFVYGLTIMELGKVEAYAHFVTIRSTAELSANYLHIMAAATEIAMTENLICEDDHHYEQKLLASKNSVFARKYKRREEYSSEFVSFLPTYENLQIEWKAKLRAIFATEFILLQFVQCELSPASLLPLERWANSNPHGDKKDTDKMFHFFLLMQVIVLLPKRKRREG